MFLWFALAIFSGTYIWGNVSYRVHILSRIKLIDQGISYVAWPRLNPPIQVLQYTGPGAHSRQRGRGMSLQAMIPMISKKGATSGSGRSGEEVELGRRKGALID